MKHSLYLLLFGAFIFFATSCKKNNESPPSVAVPPSPVPIAKKKYLALGDSYTIGQGVPETDRFPVQTQARLGTQGIDMSSPQIIAATGWTTTSLQNAIAAQNLTGSFDAVSLLIGVNDQYQFHDTTGYRQRFFSLLNTAIQLAGSRRDHVFVLSIPDYSVTPFALFSDTAFIRRQIDQFNMINKEVTLQNYCSYLDITSSTREAGYDATLLAGDGLHPSGKEYKKWAERLGSMMKTVLQ